MFASLRRLTLGRSPRRGAAGIALGALTLAALFGLRGVVSAQEAPRAIPAPVVDEPAAGVHTETAVFAGGCFWGVQGVFQHVKGVTDAVSGYAGGDRRPPHYETVSGGATGHAESVQVTFDPTQISYGKLLQIYFSVAHNPTELNRQGPDTRHAIPLGHVPDQRRRSARWPRPTSRSSTRRMSFEAPLVTKIETRQGFLSGRSAITRTT